MYVLGEQDVCLEEGVKKFCLSRISIDSYIPDMHTNIMSKYVEAFCQLLHHAIEGVSLSTMCITLQYQQRWPSKDSG